MPETLKEYIPSEAEEFQAPSTSKKELQIEKSEYIPPKESIIPPLININRQEMKLDKIELQTLKYRNFEVNCTEEILNLLNKDQLEDNLNSYIETINNLTGIKWDDFAKENIKIYLLDSKEKYNKFLDNKFSSEQSERYKKDSAVFDINKKTKEKSIICFTPINQKLNEQDRKILGELGINDQEQQSFVQKIAKAHILSGIVHELTHMHPLYNGSGNEDTLSVWEQELTCVFVENKIKSRSGGNLLLEKLFEKAKQDVNNESMFSVDKLTKFKNHHFINHFFYPYLEKTYGIRTLQKFWKTFPENLKKSFSKDEYWKALENESDHISILKKKYKDIFANSFENCFRDKLDRVEANFKNSLSKSKSYKEMGLY